MYNPNWFGRCGEKYLFGTQRQEKLNNLTRPLSTEALPLIHCHHHYNGLFKKYCNAQIVLFELWICHQVLIWLIINYHELSFLILNTKKHGCHT